jgi:hypothetical protein
MNEQQAMQPSRWKAWIQVIFVKALQSQLTLKLDLQVAGRRRTAMQVL